MEANELPIAWYQLIIILPENKYKNAWSGYFLLLVFYSCLTSAY